MLVFDSRFTTYSNLSKLNAQGVRFITLRRRGKALLRQVEKLDPWQRKRAAPRTLTRRSFPRRWTP
jgi:hypothetical protein